MHILVELIVLAIAVGLTVEVIKSAIPYLPWIWLMILAYYTWKAITSKYVLNRVSIVKDRLSPGVLMYSYVAVAIIGGSLFSIYWWGLNSFFAPRIAAYQAEQISHQQKPSKDISARPPQLPPTTSELEQHLREQIQFIQMSCKYFDEGMESEAKRIASGLNIIFIGAQYYPSLLEQLRVMDDLMFPDTARPFDKKDFLTYAGLVGMKIQSRGESSYIARCQLPNFPLSPSLLSFKKWWHAVIINDKKGVMFTRETLVLAVSKQDGGISVASKLDPNYVNLARKNAMRWKTTAGKPLMGVELASIRQIGWEVLEGLRQRYPQYFAN